MGHVADWTVTEASGRQHRVFVDRPMLLGARVTVDRRRLDRFDQTPESDRYVTSIAGHVLTVVIDVAVAGMFLLIGRAARGGRLGWYAVGTLLYVLDGLLFVFAADILGIAVHAIAVYGLISGWRAARSLKKV